MIRTTVKNKRTIFSEAEFVEMVIVIKKELINNKIMESVSRTIVLEKNDEYLLFVCRNHINVIDMLNKLTPDQYRCLVHIYRNKIMELGTLKDCFGIDFIAGPGNKYSITYMNRINVKE